MEHNSCGGFLKWGTPKSSMLIGSSINWPQSFGIPPVSGKPVFSATTLKIPWLFLRGASQSAMWKLPWDSVGGCGKTSPWVWMGLLAWKGCFVQREKMINQWNFWYNLFSDEPTCKDKNSLTLSYGPLKLHNFWVERSKWNWKLQKVFRRPNWNLNLPLSWFYQRESVTYQIESCDMCMKYHRWL